MPTNPNGFLAAYLFVFVFLYFGWWETQTLLNSPEALKQLVSAFFCAWDFLFFEASSFLHTMAILIAANMHLLLYHLTAAYPDATHIQREKWLSMDERVWLLLSLVASEFWLLPCCHPPLPCFLFDPFMWFLCGPGTFLTGCSFLLEER